MKKPLFTGVATALVTPMLGREVNYPMMNTLLKRQIDAGIPAAVIAGTTGESSTLTDGEKLRLFSSAKEFVGDKMIIIAGTGSNDTVHALELSIAAANRGVDGLLVVSPYYNKATDYGLYRYYETIAAAVSIPVIIYNVPSRTGVDIPVSVYRELARIPNIIGVKEASPNMEKMLRIRATCEEDFYLWSGNDALAVPCISLGGKGVISVTSNVCPEEMALMADAALDGDFDTAASLQKQLFPLMEGLFCEVNPIPVKAAMNLLGMDCGAPRPPLTPMEPEHLSKLKEMLA